MNFAVQGVAVGFPWNALLSSTDYYRNQLNDAASLSSLEAAMTLTYVSTNLLAFAWLNRPYAVKETRKQELNYIRMFFGLNLITFFLLAISPWLPHQVSENGGIFGTVVTIGGILGLSSAFFQHAIFAIAAREGPSKTRAYLFGFACAGTLASGVALATRSVTDPELTAALNFGMTVISLLMGFVSFMCRNLNTRVVEEQERNSDGETSISVTTGDEAESQAVDEVTEIQTPPPATPVIGVDRKKLGISLAVITLSLGGTLMIFPALVASFKPVSSDQDPHEFTALLFLFFNVGDLTGRGLASMLANVSDASMLACIVIRSVSLGFVAFCNRADVPPEDAPWLMNDSMVYALILMQGVFGGALFSAAAARAPSADPSDPGRTGKLVAATIAVALALGGLAGTVLIFLID